MAKKGQRVMKVWFVGAGPGDPELLTLKAHRLLSNCHCCIWAGSLINPQLLSILPDHAISYDSSGMTLDQIIDVICQFKEKDLDVVRMHTGEPSLYGAIGEQINRLEELKISYEIVPGISSFQAAAAIAGVELTMPEVSQTVVITRTGGRTPLPDSQTLAKIAPLKATLCIFLSIDKINLIAEELIPFYGENCPAVAIYHASWPDQMMVKGTLADLPIKVNDAGMKRTGMILVGHALGKSSTVSKLYASHFTHGYRNGTTE
jgi:precorrin-4/cobalt-precorrin-4 C11-methyltransferase